MELVRYDAACRAISEAVNIDEVKDIIDKAVAMSVYAKQARDKELLVDAVVIRKRAERRVGQLLREMKDAGELHAGKGQPREILRSEPVTVSIATLADLGITKVQSSRWQQLADLTDDEFNDKVDDIVDQVLKALDGRSTEEKAKARAEREKELAKRIKDLPDREYGVIVADPEWRFEPWSRETGMDRAADNHYPTSVLEVIKERDVESIAADDCILFLWATMPMLPHALAVMEAWGFDYKSHYVWCKDKTGTGYWSREMHELLLLGTRGDIPCPAPGAQWTSVIDAPRGEHSEKPEIFLEMIEDYFPNIPKIELNRRGPPREGWDAWGAEAEEAEQEAATNEAAE